MFSGIDRSSFLALTFGMAGGVGGLACNTGPSPSVAGLVVDIPPQPAQPRDAGAPTPARDDDPKRLATAAPPAEEEDDPDEEEDMPGAAVEGGGVPAAYKACGMADPASVIRPTGKCSDEQGAAPACAPLKQCAGFAFPRQKCEAYRRFFKPRVAQKALDCLGKLGGQQACDACKVYRCGDLAMKSACADASADATCKQIIGRCPSVSMTECQTYLSGLNAAGRQKVAACFTGKSGCGFGLFSCAEGLF
jgi:hypothetical protein